MHIPQRGWNSTINQHQKDIKCHDIPWYPMKKTHGRSLGPGRVRGQGMLRNSELHWGASWSAGDQIFCGDWIMDIVQKNIQYIYIYTYTMITMIRYDMLWYDMILLCIYIYTFHTDMFVWECIVFYIYIYVRAGQTVCRLILYAESQMRHFYPIVTTHN